MSFNGVKYHLAFPGSNPSGSNKFVSIHDPCLGDPKDAQVTKRIDIRKESALCCCQRDIYTLLMGVFF
jgi:hypothetical protein